jgi:hypothetical protein
MKLNKIKKKVLSSVEATNITINILFRGSIHGCCV